MRIVLALAIVGIVVYSLFEARFWSTETGRSVVSPRQRRLRTVGLVLLLAGLSFWFRGTYIPVPVVHPGLHYSRALKIQALHWVEYWIFTFCLMLPLIPLAIFDTRENLRTAVRERAAMAAERRRIEAQMTGENEK